MGNGFGIKCKKCGYHYVAMDGIGYMFPVEYSDTVKDIREGKYGDEYKMFFEKHKDAAVNCGNETAVCTKCGHLDSVMNLSLYLPKDGNNSDGCVMPRVLEEDFDKCLEYDHTCSECGGKMLIISPEDEIRNGALKCPICGEILIEDKDVKIIWD